MGRIEDKHKKRKEEDTPLGKFGNRNEKNNNFDIDEKTIKKQKKKE